MGTGVHPKSLKNLNSLNIVNLSQINTKLKINHYWLLQLKGQKKFKLKNETVYEYDQTEIFSN